MQDLDIEELIDSHSKYSAKMALSYHIFTSQIRWAMANVTAKKYQIMMFETGHLET